jgi:hypothetical protein
MPHPGPAELKMGDTVIGTHKRLPGFSFTASPTKAQSIQRSQTGKLYTNKLYEKYTINISGLSQEQFEDLRFEFRKDVFIDLLSIVKRKEVFSGDGSTTIFFTSRRMRLDDFILIPPEAFHPPGITVTGITFSNTATAGKLDFVSPPASGTDNIVVEYYPIINGIISEMTSTFDWTRDEENWNLTFEEG